MSRLGFLNVRAWMDDDGQHVWLAHDCANGRDVSMLPWPTWRAVGDKVQPSIDCHACGTHCFAELGRGADRCLT